MAAIITQKFRVRNALQLLSGFTQQSIYMWIGRQTAWPLEQSSSSSSSSNVPSPVDSQEEEYTHWRGMLGAKRVDSNNSVLVVPRINWTSGTVYSQYDDTDTDLVSRSFYVLTDEMRVYKCIGNNYGAASTTKPTSTSTTLIKNDPDTQDGYIWKYMYTIAEIDAERFLDGDWMPVRTLTTDDGSDQWDVQQAAIAGSIDNIILSTFGSGFSSAPTVTISGDGTGATAVAVLESDASSSSSTGDSLLRINVTNRGSGYTKATVTLSGGGGTGAEARAIIAPVGGHGSDAVNELIAKTVCARAKFRFDDPDFPSTNDYRKIGLVVNPIDADTDETATKSTYSQMTILTLSSALVYPLMKDSLITQGSVTARVVESTTTVIKVNEVTGGTFNTSSLASGTDEIGGSVTNMDFSTITEPELDKGTGAIIYVENRDPITRTTNQSEDIRIFVMC